MILFMNPVELVCNFFKNVRDKKAKEEAVRLYIKAAKEAERGRFGNEMLFIKKRALVLCKKELKKNLKLLKLCKELHIRYKKPYPHFFYSLVEKEIQNL